jgi:hypothetical protein
MIAMLISTVAFVAPSSASNLPFIVSWTVTPTSLPQTGGSIFIEGLVGQANTCELFSAPATIPGLPLTQDCTGGEASTTVTVPANTTNQKHIYWIYLSAQGAGTVAPAPIKVTVAGIPVPSLKSFTATPNSLPPSGGPVTLAATVSFANTCTFSARPAVPGLPVTLPCSSGSVTKTVTVPANHTALPISYFFYIHPVGVGWPRPTPFPLGVVVNVPPPPGYWLLGGDGGVFTFGAAQFYGSTGSIHLNKPVVAMAPTPDGHGYWLVASDGGVFTFGDAHFYGSMGAHPLNQPVVGMAVTADGHGYWLVASDGGVFTFGDAQFYGSTAGQPLLRPIVGMAEDPATGGYWLAASNGGVFSFNAAYFPNSGGLNKAVSVTSTVSGNGYWILTSDGGVHWFGAAGNYGSVAGAGGGGPKATVGLCSAAGSTGYDVASANGTVNALGGAIFLGDMSKTALNAPIIDIATPQP